MENPGMCVCFSFVWPNGGIGINFWDGVGPDDIGNV